MSPWGPFLTQHQCFSHLTSPRPPALLPSPLPHGAIPRASGVSQGAPRSSSPSKTPLTPTGPHPSLSFGSRAWAEAAATRGRRRSTDTQERGRKLEGAVVTSSKRGGRRPDKTVEPGQDGTPRLRPTSGLSRPALHASCDGALATSGQAARPIAGWLSPRKKRLAAVCFPDPRRFYGTTAGGEGWLPNQNILREQLDPGKL